MGLSPQKHPSAAKAEVVFDISIGTAEAVPFQSGCCSRFQIQMRLPRQGSMILLVFRCSSMR